MFLHNASHGRTIKVSPFGDGYSFRIQETQDPNEELEVLNEPDKLVALFMLGGFKKDGYVEANGWHPVKESEPWA